MEDPAEEGIKHFFRWRGAEGFTAGADRVVASVAPACHAPGRDARAGDGRTGCRPPHSNVQTRAQMSGITVSPAESLK